MIKIFQIVNISIYASVLDDTHSDVALLTQKTSNFSGSMIVIHVELLFLSANFASVILALRHQVPFDYTNAVKMTKPVVLVCLRCLPIAFLFFQVRRVCPTMLTLPRCLAWLAMEMAATLIICTVKFRLTF
jgi:hypothetical protein